MTSFDAIARAVRVNLAGRCEVPEGTPLIAACSGGADSVSLVHALAACRETWPVIGVCFVDHGLRDVSADRAAAAAAAAACQIPFQATRANLPAEGNLQAQAREARYALLEQVAGEDACIATGHTRSDQAETLLHRILRGTGLRGLAGIRYRQGRWVRPLLTVSRDETRAAGFSFYDDPSNATDNFARNRLRHHLLPQLAEENPNVERALAALAGAAQDEMALVDALTTAWENEVGLEGFPAHLAEVLVRWRAREVFPDRPPPSRRATKALAEHLVRGSLRASASLGSGVLGTARAGRLGLEEEVDPRKHLVMHATGSYVLGSLHVTLEEGRLTSLDETHPADGTVSAAITDVRWPITCRPARSTDRVQQRDGDVLLSTISSLRGFGGEDNGRPLVFTDGLGRVLWVPGIFSVSSEPWGSNAKQVLLITMTRTQ